MTERSVDSVFRQSLLDNDAYIYYNLIKFERPQLSSTTGDISPTATDYSYLTDAPFNVKYDDGNGEQDYIANKILNLGSISETIEARATTMNLTLSSAALGSWLITTPVITATYIEAPNDFALEGFREGDKVLLSTTTGLNDGKFIRFDRFTSEHSSGIRNSRVYYTAIDSISADSGDSYTISIGSEEIRNLTSPKEGGALIYSSYINREVMIYRVHANPETGKIVGTYDTSGALVDGPWLLFRGIISSADLNETPDKTSTISWGLTSHWGDFVRTNGRLTSDATHRALSVSGVPDANSVVRPEYSNDYGFIHAERAVNVAAQFTYKELRYNYKDASTLNKLSFGLFGSGPKMQEYEVDVERDVDLRFNLNARHLPVVYGVQLVENNPVFVDVNKDDPAEVYVAYALCEGEIGGIYDIYIDDQSSVCLDQADYDARAETVVTDEDNVDVVCYGRADKGFVLSGNNYLEATEGRFPFDDLTRDLWSDRGIRWGFYYGGNPRDTRLGNTYNNPNPAGLIHESQWTFDVPIDATLMVHTGKSDQEANQELVRLAANKQFKVQSDYFLGTAEEYWSSSHRLLDTAYVVGRFRLSEGEESLPEYKFVVNGKYIDCHNYDASYKVVSGTVADYNVGDTVTVDGGGVVHSNVRIIDKFTIYDKDGNADIRFRWLTNWPNAGDTLVDNDVSSTVVMTATAKSTITMRPSGYVTDTGTISASPTTTSSSASYTEDTEGGILTVTLVNDASFFTMLNAGGVNNVYISPTSKRTLAFKVIDIAGTTLTLAAYPSAANYLTNNIGETFVISNGIVATNTLEDNNLLYVNKTVNGVVETREKTILTRTGSYIFTKNPFGSDFYPESGDTFTGVWEHRDLRTSINPAIQTLDYITSRRYGQGLDIDTDIDLPSWLESARLCDDRSKVTVVTTSSTVGVGAVYNYENSGRIVFQGTVSSVSSHVYNATTYYAIEFDQVIGKLGYKWNDWRNFTIGDYIWYNGVVKRATSSGTKTLAQFDALPTEAPTLTKISGTGPATFSVSTTNLGGVKGTNPIVRAWSQTDSAFSLPGYSLYDSDDVIYWKYLGWAEPEQRYVTRHQTNQIVQTNAPVFDNVNAMLAQFNGMLRYVNGKYQLDVRTAAPDITSMEVGVHRLSEEDIIGNIRLNDKGSKKSYNSISANIFDPQNKFASRAVTFYDSTYLKEDRGIPKQGRLNYPAITNYYNARLNVVQYLKESRYGLTINFTMDQKGALLLPGEIIALSYSRFEWYDKLFRVQTLDIRTNGDVAVTAKEHNDAAYLLDYADRDLSYTSSTIKSGKSIIPPNNLTASQGLDGAIQLSWTNSPYYDPATYDIEIWATEATKDTSGDYVLDTSGDPVGNDFSNATLLDATDGTTYLHVLAGTPPTNLDQHVWFYWIRYVKPPVGFREKPSYSPYEPLSSGPGVEGRAYEEIADTARTVKLVANTLVARYDDNFNLINPTTQVINFEAIPFNTVQTPFYYFEVYDSAGVSTGYDSGGYSETSTWTYNPPDTLESDTIDSRWLPELVRVYMREGPNNTGDDPATYPLQAIDLVMVQGVSDASDSIEVFQSNNSHPVFLDAEGVPDFTGSGTSFEVLEGATQLTPYPPTTAFDPTDPTPPNLDPGEFVVLLDEISPAGAVNIDPDWTTGTGSTFVIPDHTSLEADTATLTYRIIVQRLSGLQEEYRDTQTLYKIASPVARSAKLFASDYSIVYDGDGENPTFNANTSGNLELRGTSQGFTDPYYRFLIDGVAITTSEGEWQSSDTNLEAVVEAPGSFPPATYSPGSSIIELEVKEGIAGSVAANDANSIAFFREGLSGLSGVLTNESHSVKAASDGTGYDLTGSGGYFEVYKGSVNVSTDCTFEVNSVPVDTNGISEATTNGLTFSIDNNPTNIGQYILTDTTAGWDGTGETFNVKATYGTLEINKVYSITKVFDGTGGRAAAIEATDWTVVYDEDDTSTPSQTVGITITVTAYGYTSPQYSFEVEEAYVGYFEDNGNLYNGTAPDWSVSDNTIKFTPPNSYTDWVGGACMVWAKVREGTDNATTVVSAQAIQFTYPGKGAFTIEISNPTQGLPEIGGALLYDTSDTWIRVFEGKKLLGFQDAGVLSASVGATDKWRISDREYGGGLLDFESSSPPDIQELTKNTADTELSAYINELDQNVSDPWLHDTDEYINHQAWCDYTLEIRRYDETSGSEFMVIRQIWTRNVVGADGEPTFGIFLDNANYVVGTNSEDEGYDNALWSESGTTMAAYFGQDQLTYTTGAGTPNTWKLTGATSSSTDVVVHTDVATGNQTNITANYLRTDGKTLDLPPMNSGLDTQPWSDRYAEVVYDVIIYDATGSPINPVVPPTQRFTRAPGGNPAVDSVSVILTNEAHTIPTDSIGENGDYTGSGTDVYFYLGDTALNFSNVNLDAAPVANTWTVFSETASGITADTTPTDGGVYASYGPASNMTADTAYIDYKVYGYGATTSQRIPSAGGTYITKRMSFSKSRGGTAVRVEADAYVLNYGDDGASNPDSAIIIRAYTYGYDDPYFSFNGLEWNDGSTYINGDDLDGTGTDRRTWTPVPSTYAIFGPPKTLTVKVREGPGGDPSTLTQDSITISAIRDGADGATGATGAAGDDAIHLEIDTHSLNIPCYEDGTPKEQNCTGYINKPGSGVTWVGTAEMFDGDSNVTGSTSFNVRDVNGVLGTTIATDYKFLDDPADELNDLVIYIQFTDAAGTGTSRGQYFFVNSAGDEWDTPAATFNIVGTYGTTTRERTVTIAKEVDGEDGSTITIDVENPTSNVSVILQGFSSSDFDSGSATAGVQFDSDLSVYNRKGGAYIDKGDWVVGDSPSNSDYEAKFELISGTALTSNNASTWSVLSSDRYALLQRTSEGTSSSQVKGSIRSASSGQLLATANYTLFAGVQSTAQLP